MMSELKVPESKWALEGHEIVTSFVYNITKGTMPTDEYVLEARKIVHK